MILALYNAAFQFGLSLLIFGSVSHTLVMVVGHFTDTRYRRIIVWSRQAFLVAAILIGLLLTLKGVYFIGDWIAHEVSITTEPDIGL